MSAEESSPTPAVSPTERLWCSTCARTVEPEEAGDDRRCPVCGDAAEMPPPVPWHFKLLVLAVVLYLAYRAFQGVAWLVAHL